jgi:ERCC4-type nuclease
MATTKPQAVVIDAREPEWVRGLPFDGAPVTVDYLPAGDLWATCADGTVVAVERKTPTDFLGSLREDRLFRQAAGVRDVTAWGYLVVTGWFEPTPDGMTVCREGPTGFTPRATSWGFGAVQGALLTVQDIGLHVIACAGDEAYGETVRRLVGRDRGRVRLHPMRPAVTVDDREAFLCGLPGVGPEKARALLDYCGSPAFALHCLTEEGATSELPRGISASLRERARRLLDLPDGFFLAVNATESLLEVTR